MKLLPARKIYYGWYILVGVILAQFMATSTGQMVSGVFLDPLVEALQIEVWQFAAAISLATALGGISMVFIGPLVDRIGPRRLMLAGAMFSAIGLVGLSIQSAFIFFFLFQAINRALGPNLYGGPVLNATVTKWFVVNRGWALAIGSMGVSLGGIIAPISMTYVVDNFGWRTGYVTMAGIVILVIVPIAFIMRRQPEDVGLLPDGISRSSQGGAGEERARAAIATDNSQTHTRGQAIRTRGFWLLTIGYGLNAVALGSVSFYAIPFASSVGFTRLTAATGMMINGFGNLTAKGVWGYGLQRIDARRLAGAAFSTSATGVLIMVLSSNIDSIPVLWIGFFLYGLGFGGTIPISEFLWARYFGRRHIGAIRGVGRPISMVFSMGGPVAIGVIFDITGSYVGAFLVLVCFYILGAVVINVSKPPLPLVADEQPAP